MTAQPLAPGTALLPKQCLIIVNCSREKLVTSAPVPALQLYQGACVPRMRAHLVSDPARLVRIRILSAAHGLLHPDDAIHTYDRRLRTKADALRLHEHRVHDQLDAELAETPDLTHLLVIVEPLYLLALQRLFDHLDRLTSVTIIPDPWGFHDGMAVLRQWGWA